MQLRFQDKEHFFHDIAQMLRSGIPVQRALELLGGGRGRAASAARAAAARMDDGLAAAARGIGFSELDIGILAAGEQSGRLEESCRELADYYEHLAKARRAALAASAYPVFVLHLGAVLLSIPAAIQSGGVFTFLWQAGTFLGAAYFAAALAGALLWFMGKSFASNAAADRLISTIPVAGGFFRCAALARFCMVLSLGIRSADGVLASIARAGRASGSARLDAGSGRAVAAIRAGENLSEALRETRVFPADLERALEVAEASGRLDEEIARWSGIYRERLFQRIEALAEWLPRALYLLVVLLVVFRMFTLISQVTKVYSEALEI
ncbi:MAG: type II secretion system F family protein [Verrucomicrobiae bacterium]